MPARGVRLGVLLVVVVLLSSACGAKTPNPPDDIPPAPTPASGGLPWPAPADPLALTVKAGLTPETHEFLIFHVHAHLDVFVNGKPVQVPAGIGINIKDPAVHHEVLEDGSDAYGGIDPACDQPCISPLHTHDVSGVLHTESLSEKPNRLGQFFTEWDVKLDASCVGGYCKPQASILVYVDGAQYDGNPGDIELTDHKEIAIVIGTAPLTVPSKFNFG
jgi:hypothetical protein